MALLEFKSHPAAAELEQCLTGNPEDEAATCAAAHRLVVAIPTARESIMQLAMSQDALGVCTGYAYGVRNSLPFHLLRPCAKVLVHVSWTLQDNLAILRSPVFVPEDEILAKWDRNRIEAANRGTWMHYQFERWYPGR